MKIFLLLGIINGFLAVALGAFGAHGLESRLSEKMLATWEKAVQYQMFHTVALLAAGLLMQKITAASITSAGWFFFAGILLFSGSLYIYSTTGIKTFAMITPIGGLAFLIGWILLGYAVVKFI
ncbi:Uncharacterized membrane protein YgdD, TMEM256/DUF423 family [Gracilibacillus ureilyticus]|uniref:Uncharacterized membrane protein YgdD, TMEM256/DUF423 family n=1 Tax=Gracilibacillus ureilyticus TaxID=531814 RepID=A0A1H9SV94_9BACI|nr:DUF423 domain-containing protein [Gracilibacillus ureilyticus]SER88932.1 Uncharacterized membrane protein YgdD, TMEM256/DUF423 family [Gracilibacillus ureilyticus]